MSICKVCHTLVSDSGCLHVLLGLSEAQWKNLEAYFALLLSCETGVPARLFFSGNHPQEVRDSEISYEAMKLFTSIKSGIFKLYWSKEVGAPQIVELLEDIAADCKERAEFVINNSYSRESKRISDEQ